MRRIMPALTLFLAFLLDTAILPVFYRGSSTIVLSLCVVLCISLRLGKVRGAVYGFCAGLLIDITAGTVPFMSIALLASGFLCALIVRETEDERISTLKFHLRRFAIAFFLYAVQDIVFTIFGYFQTAAFPAKAPLHIALRCLITAGLTVVLCPLLSRIYPEAYTSQQKTDEKEDSVY